MPILKTYGGSRFTVPPIPNLDTRLKPLVLHPDFFINKEKTIAYNSVWVPETVGTFRGREKSLVLTGNRPQTVQCSVDNSDIISGSLISVV